MNFYQTFFFCLVLLFWSCKRTEEIVEKYPNQNPKTLLVKNSDQEVILKRQYHINNVRKAEYEMQNGEANGAYSSWNLEGGIKETGTMKNAKRDGQWTVWYDRKTPHWQGAYQEGKKEGEWREYWYEGQLKRTINFAQGDTTGVEKHFSRKGQLVLENSCHSQQGHKNLWALNGVKIRSEECVKGLQHGAYKEWDEVGDLIVSGFFSKGQKDSTWIYYRKGLGPRRIENYKNGLRKGLQVHLNNQGDTLLNSDLPEGNGKLSYYCNPKDLFCPETTFVNGQIDGTVLSKTSKSYREDIFDQGNIQSSIWYAQDSTGARKKAQGFYKNAKKDSTWKSWYASGVLRLEQNWKNGELMGSEKFYDSLGNLSLEKIHRGKNMPLEVKIK